jgi:hypothetical protein
LRKLRFLRIDIFCFEIFYLFLNTIKFIWYFGYFFTERENHRLYPVHFLVRKFCSVFQNFYIALFSPKNANIDPFLGHFSL